MITLVIGYFSVLSRLSLNTCNSSIDRPTKSLNDALYSVEQYVRSQTQPKLCPEWPFLFGRWCVACSKFAMKSLSDGHVWQLSRVAHSENDVIVCPWPVGKRVNTKISLGIQYCRHLNRDAHFLCTLLQAWRVNTTWNAFYRTVNTQSFLYYSVYSQLFK